MSSNRDLWVNRCRQKIPSRFALAQAAVLRWEQLLRGARPRITTENPKWMETPLREIADEAVSLDTEEFVVKLGGTPYEPPRPEPGDDLDELLGDALSKIEDEALNKEVVEAAPKTAPTPVVETAKEEVVTVKDVAEVAASVESDSNTGSPSDPETAASDDDKEKVEVPAGDVA